MRRLRVAALALLALICAFGPAVAAGLGRPLFEKAPAAWVESFKPFQDWLRTSEGRQLTVSLAPKLSYLQTINLAQPSGASALAPLAAHLPENVQALLAAPAGLGAEQRAELFSVLAHARSAAAPEVEARTAQAFAELTAAGDDASPEEALALQEQLKGLALYGASVGQRYKAVRRMAAERAMRNADAAAARLLSDWRPPQPLDSAGPATAPDWTAPQDPRKIRLPLALPPSPFYDSRNWSQALVPDRGYAERLDAAAQIFSSADQAPSPQSGAAMNAKDELLATLKAKDPKTHSHMMRVGLLAGLIAWKMGLPMEFAVKTSWGARLHDMGKREEAVLTVIKKEGQLTAEERVVMERHTSLGAGIIAAARGLDSVSRRVGRKVALTHHETVDGKGYPQALSAHEIPLESRITNLADYYDALMENRPYRAGMTSTEALKIMEVQKAKFDPAAWKAFRAILD
ncbi:MAG: HD domain-containing protein [Elusimicrobia bacterium]|nr:HD domain-containing protein [Elusimicrobiota bacterium]